MMRFRDMNSHDRLEALLTDWETINDLEAAVVAHPDWRQGVMYGAPRKGHPEGQVLFHICEVLSNIDRYQARLSQQEFENLRFIALVHDSMKFQVDRTKSRVGSNNHAHRARLFAEHFTNDQNVLNIIEYHDHAYYAWRTGSSMEDWSNARRELHQLLVQVEDQLPLFWWFYRCDTETGDKDQTPLTWFASEVCERIGSPAWKKIAR